METWEVELNEKLARWAGFKYQSRSRAWTSPDKLFDMRLPDFTRSLDECFRWLVPEVPSVLIESRGNQHWATAVPSDELESTYLGAGDTPALALCRAIEQMIDSEVTAGGK